MSNRDMEYYDVHIRFTMCVEMRDHVDHDIKPLVDLAEGLAYDEDPTVEVYPAELWNLDLERV